MRNPFHHGGAVSSEGFCNSEAETGDLVKVMESGQKRRSVFQHHRLANCLVPASRKRRLRKLVAKDGNSNSNTVKQEQDRKEQQQ